MELSNNAADPSVLRFIQDAHAFCLFIENLTTARPVNCYTTLLPVLSSLVASANRLSSEMLGHEVTGNRRMTHEEWSRLARSLGDVLAPEAGGLVERYRDDENELGRVTMLWDDLADIYRDLKDGLVAFALGTADAQSDAIWDWRFGYEYHWGRHLMRAISTAHEIRFDLHVE